MPKQIIRPLGLPDPSATRAYSHGVRAGNLLFLAGQTGHDAPPQPGSEPALSAAKARFEVQTRRAFARIQTILEAAGGSLDNLVTIAL